MERPFENKMQNPADLLKSMSDQLAAMMAQQEAQLAAMMETMPEAQQAKIRNALVQAKKCRTLEEVNALIRSIYANPI
jgi:hypothetical protein